MVSNDNKIIHVPRILADAVCVDDITPDCKAKALECTVSTFLDKCALSCKKMGYTPSVACSLPDCLTDANGCNCVDENQFCYRDPDFVANAGPQYQCANGYQPIYCTANQNCVFDYQQGISVCNEA